MHISSCRQYFRGGLTFSGYRKWGLYYTPFFCFRRCSRPRDVRLDKRFTKCHNKLRHTLRQRIVSCWLVAQLELANKRGSPIKPYLEEYQVHLAIFQMVQEMQWHLSNICFSYSTALLCSVWVFAAADWVMCKNLLRKLLHLLLFTKLFLVSTVSSSWLSAESLNAEALYYTWIRSPWLRPRDFLFPPLLPRHGMSYWFLGCRLSHLSKPSTQCYYGGPEGPKSQFSAHSNDVQVSLHSNLASLYL